MEEIKIENFRRNNPNRDFPKYETLSASDAKKIEEIIAGRLEMPPSSSPLDLVTVIREKSSLIPGVQDVSDDFDLKAALLNAGVSPNGQVFINWYRFDQIDKMSLDDVSAHLDDIWYPAADHIDLFDDSFSWIASIGYSAEVMILKLD